MHLVNTATGNPIEPGAMLHVTTGPRTGEAWRFEKITPHATDGHRVHCTRRHPRIGRIHREFHPGVFGARVMIDITWHRHVRNVVRHAWSKADDYLLAGTFALLPLAFFEHFGIGDRLIEMIGLGD